MSSDLSSRRVVFRNYLRVFSLVDFIPHVGSPRTLDFENQDIQFSEDRFVPFDLTRSSLLWMEELAVRSSLTRPAVPRRVKHETLDRCARLDRSRNRL